MYFNDGKNNTSIDKELGEKTILSILKRNLKKIIIFGIILLIIILLIIWFIKFLNNRVTFKLLGDSYITLNTGEEYIEPGYIATNNKGVDISNQVITSGTVDTSIPKLYEIIYRLNNKKLSRKVKVIDNPVITLEGDEIVYLSLDEEYKEPGYTCIDSIDGDITSKVLVTNDINISKRGAYKVIYTVTNSANITATTTRIVVIK